jgi:SAM-dependent methyltransferase
VYGIEPSEHAAEITRQQGIQVFRGTIEAYAAQALDTTQFDLITANHVIEHVPNPVATLSVMKRLLAPGGYIWISVPNAAYPIARMLRGRWHSCDLPYHLMHFSPASMVEAGLQAALQVRHQRTESIPSIVAGSISQLLRDRFLIPRRISSRAPPVRTFARMYAKRVDARAVGEAILTEFVPT